MPVDKFGRMSDTKTKDTGVSLTYINNNYVRSDGSNPVTGSIDMRGNTLYNVSDPVNPQMWLPRNTLIKLEVVILRFIKHNMELTDQEEI